jgi:hypothetical protein
MDQKIIFKKSKTESLQQHIDYLRAPRTPNKNWISFRHGGGSDLGKNTD